ncbi:MAG: phage major tail protein, TP901-1 family [Maricaulaceae bacterium]
MAAQKGREVLIKIEEPQGSGVFQTAAGLRTKTFALASEAVDATHADSPGGWREVLSGAGVRSATVSGSGVFVDSDADAAMRDAFFDQDARTYQLIVPDFGTFEGPFLITALEYAGQYDGEATVSLTLTSAGALSFTADD